MLTSAIVLLAAGLHRIGGMGFALMAMPVLIMLLGPENGMRLGLLLGLMVSLVALMQTWRSVDPKITALLALPALAAIPLGALVAHLVPPPVLLVTLGALLAALLLLCGRFIPATDNAKSLALPLSVGLLAGFIHALCGLSAPILTAYAMAVNWPHRSFVASSQVVFILFNGASLTVWGWSLELVVQAAVLSPVLVLGVVAGTLIRRMISARSAMIVTLALAWASAAGAILKGLLGLAA